MCECICSTLGDAYQCFVAGAAKTARPTFYTGLKGTTGRRSGFDIRPIHAAYTATLFQSGKEGVAFLHVVGAGKGISLEIHAMAHAVADMVSAFDCSLLWHGGRTTT